MEFNKLRLLGFKSFVEPTEFAIEKGLTGVVGPNGCGKSNLVEALRWVMGENSYKNMRASSMDDVIFSGSGNRPSRNMAEVALFLDNQDRQAPRRRRPQQTERPWPGGDGVGDGQGPADRPIHQEWYEDFPYSILSHSLSFSMN